MCNATGIKNHGPITKKQKERHDEIVLLAKVKLNTIKVSIPKALMDSYINHDEFILINNTLREYNEMKEEIKISQNAMEYTI